MTRRSFQEWQTIIEQQEASGLSIIEFCEQQQLNQKYFYAKRDTLRKKKPSKPTVSFVKVSQTPTVSAAILLQVNNARLTLPLNCEPLWLAQLLKAISS
jgi:hypothetical protein